MGTDYTALERFLRATPHHVQELTLSFKQIELILGSTLPKSHLDWRQFWENQSDAASRPQARAWTNAGFRVSKVDQTGGWVTFTKGAEV
jgi:hypothetical protein